VLNVQHSYVRDIRTVELIVRVPCQSFIPQLPIGFRCFDCMVSISVVGDAMVCEVERVHGVVRGADIWC
jgi:hypothetical protein